ncbi:DUF1631 family protein [Rhodoferax sp.]|uniref:DUF1631 family protein n=1 Tax=Rhodoferax sp. TaxID=50421 RepID=UPI0025D10A01|nr:DUF1631 family protein [Rhodoferax sp.]
MAQRIQLAQETRKRFLAELGRAMVELGATARQRLTELMNETASSRDMQSRRDAWTLYQSRQAAWVEATLIAWQTSLKPPAAAPKRVADSDLELVGTEVVEDKIIASRLVLSVMEKVSAEFNDLSVRTKLLEGTPELQDHDIFRPEVLLLLMIEQWAVVGMPRDAWSLVNEAARTLLTQRLNQAYANANALLIKQGVLPTIELKDRVRRITSAPSRTGPSSRPAPVAARSEPDGAPSRGSAPSSDYDTGGGSVRGGAAASGPGSQAGRSGATGQSGHAGYGGHGGSQPSGFFGSAAEETRMMTSSTPLARARTRAQGVLGQLKRFLLGSGTSDFEATHYEAPSPALAAAMALRSPPVGVYSGSAVMLDMDSPAAVTRVAGELRQRTIDLKNKAETKSEKAIIEIVALMFQAILQEERIPPGIRVWFARLQMPVLRLALAEPDFFGTLNHPARQLIDRMGSCVMGFDASGISGSAMEAEIKRVVQVIEQYPETGRRVYQLVYDEFQKFLAKFLTGRGSAQKAVSVAQQVEQKETLTIQYTIEMRNMLKDMPVRDEIREFLFKVWAEVLAVAAVRKGPQHEETLAFKKTATDLLWSASAKPNRSDRARVIADLPKLLEKLRAGMTLLGVAPSEQQRHIQTISDTLADAFLSKTQAIGSEQIAAMAAHLAHLENFVTDDGLGDLPLDAQSIEMMLGIDATTIDVVADGGSQPSAAMLAWAQELQVGAWFTLDHNGKTAQVQFAWRSDRKHLHLFASTTGHSYLMQTGRLAAYLQAGLLLPQEEETLTVRATRDALGKLEANPERLLS